VIIMSGLSAVRGLNDVGAAQIAELLEVALTRQTAALEAVMEAKLEAKLAALETRIGSRLAALEAKAPNAPMTDAPLDLSMLPESLRAFEILGDAAKIRDAAATVDAVGLERTIMLAPRDAAAVEALGPFATALAEAYDATIAARLREKGLFDRCFRAIKAGAEAFDDVYGAVWKMVLDAESATKAAYVADVAAVVARPRAAAGAKPRQATAEIASLYRDAAVVRPAFNRVVADVVAALSCTAELSIPDALKRSQRVVEKAALKRDGKGDVSSVLDVVRAMIVVKKLDHARLALLGLAARDDALEIVRVKERFFDAPSRGGWRDLMVNVRVSVDGVAHVCEIQIVHEMLLTARRGLPGHGVYARVRNATELLEFKLGADVAGDALSLAFLHEATGGGHAVAIEGARSSYESYSKYSRHHSHKSGHQVFLGDKGWLSDAPPGAWLGVTADPVTGRVIGLELRDKGLKNSVPSDVANLDELESIDLRTNPDLAAELQEGLRLLDLLDMTGQMHFTDKDRTQRFLRFIALSDDERSRTVEDAREVVKFGPDAHLLRALVSSCGGTQDASQRRWFDKEEDVRKWCGVELDDAKRVVSVDLYAAGLTSITALPERLGDCAALTTLNLSDCGSLTSLPDLSQLTKLRITSVPKHLSVWTAHGHQRYNLMDDFFPSTSTHIDMGSFQGAALPERLGDCAALTSLNLENCRSLTTAALERLGDCAALKTLCLRDCTGLAALPERLGDCAALTTLNQCSCTSLTALPERLGDCAALTTLSLGYCMSLTTAALERLGDCAALTSLDLHECKSLTALPERLGDCVALTSLNLSLCWSLTALPERLRDCAALTSLDLRRCLSLTALPERLRSLEHLEITGGPKSAKANKEGNIC
jgi:Leucine-rich repeat (LRR) protein